MAEIVNKLHDQNFLEGYRQTQISKFRPQIEFYLQNLVRKRYFPEVDNLTTNRIANIIFRNTLMSEILEDQEYLKILDREKAMRGDVKIGVVDCIDGRLPIPFLFGRSINVKEVAGSLIELDEYKNTITDRRFIAILEQTAGQHRELLQIVTAHTSLRHPAHKCGRITAGIQRNEFRGEIDEAAWQEAEKRADAIENKYNEILLSKGRVPQARVSLTAMIDTDTMGLIFNFGQENMLSTTDLTNMLAPEIEQELNESAGSFGSMYQNFSEPTAFLEYSNKVLTVTEYLMDKSYQSPNLVIKKYIEKNFPELTRQQEQALIFTVCRTIANQYVTGLSSTKEFDHPYLEHNEDYMVVAPHGKAFGGFDMRQSFGSVPASREEMLDHVKTKLSLLDLHKGKTPYILFLSTPIIDSMLEGPNTAIVAAEDAAKAYYGVLFADEEIKQRIEDGTLIIVPILIDDQKNRKPIQIVDYSIYLN